MTDDAGQNRLLSPVAESERDEVPDHELPEEKVALTPLRIALGVIAIIVGIGAGLLMSTATLLK